MHERLTESNRTLGNEIQSATRFRHQPKVKKLRYNDVTVSYPPVPQSHDTALYINGPATKKKRLFIWSKNRPKFVFLLSYVSVLIIGLTAGLLPYILKYANRCEEDRRILGSIESYFRQQEFSCKNQTYGDCNVTAGYVNGDWNGKANENKNVNIETEKSTKSVDTTDILELIKKFIKTKKDQSSVPLMLIEEMLSKFIVEIKEQNVRTGTGVGIKPILLSCEKGYIRIKEIDHAGTNASNDTLHAFGQYCKEYGTTALSTSRCQVSLSLVYGDTSVIDSNSLTTIKYTCTETG